MAKSKLFTYLSNTAQAEVAAAQAAIDAKITNIKNYAKHVGQEITAGANKVVNGVEGGIGEGYNIVADILDLPLSSSELLPELSNNLSALTSEVHNVMAVAPLNGQMQIELDKIVNNYNLDTAEAIAIYQAKMAAEAADDAQAMADALARAEVLATKIGEPIQGALAAITNGIRQAAMAEAADIKMHITKEVAPIYSKAATKKGAMILGKSQSGQVYAGNTGKQALQDMADKYGQGEITWQDGWGQTE
jgi:hypothetical protein